MEEKDFEDNILENVFKSFYEEEPASLLQINSFNNFINFKLPRIIEQESCITSKIDNFKSFRVFFSNIVFEKPFIVDHSRTIRYIHPAECKLRDITYQGQLYADINTCYIERDPKTNETSITNYVNHRRKQICKIPVCVGSNYCNLYGKSKESLVSLGECPHDVGGYFIIKGKERCIVSQQRGVYNYPFVFFQKGHHYLELRSMSIDTKHSVLIQMKMEEKKIVMAIPYVSSDISLGILLRAYGISYEELKLIVQHIYDEEDEFTEQLFLEYLRCKDKEEAIDVIAEHVVCSVKKENKGKFVLQILQHEILPHLGLYCNDSLKITSFLLMMKKLVFVTLGKLTPDDRDNIKHKRIEGCGVLISDLFTTLLKRFSRTMITQLEKRQDLIIITNKLSMLTLGLSVCFATGNWGLQKSSYLRQGVSQVLSRLTYCSYLSHLRRFMVPSAIKESKDTKLRSINLSEIGFICPSESPEGQQVGVVKQMSSFVHLTLYSDNAFVKKVIEELQDTNCMFENLYTTSKENISIVFIFLNGVLISFTKNVLSVLNQLSYLKKNEILDSDVSFLYNKEEKQIDIYCDEGRLKRPLLTRKHFPTMMDLKMKSFGELVNDGHIIYLDTYEAESSVIAFSYQEFISNNNFEYLELHPSVISSLSMGLIPFNDHTQAPRNTYHCAMGKQAIGLPFTNLEYRSDTTMHIMHYPEKPIIQSHHSLYNNGSNLPFGVNLVCLVSSYTGYNQEDSLILNQGAIDRGILRITTYKTLSVEEKKKNTLSVEVIKRVSPEFQNISYNYNKVDDNGIIKKGQFISIGDVIVAKLTKLHDKKKDDCVRWKDTSVICKSGEEGWVSDVYITTNQDGYKLVKIKVATMRIPRIGDKLASRCAQKGTISCILPEVDCPFSESGIIPDVIISPLAFPSRMTINQILEGFLSKLSVNKVNVLYCTSFSKHSTNIIDSTLSGRKTTIYDEEKDKDLGKEWFRNGFTGERFKCKLSVGCVYYHRLKHLVDLKLHSRNTGSKVFLTRQPLEGRSRSGGLRMGEMERDCLLSQGVSSFLRERLFLMSDPFTISVCYGCGYMIDRQADNTCRICKKFDSVRTVPIPYAAKLLIQQLFALNLKINIFPKTFHTHMIEN